MNSTDEYILSLIAGSLCGELTPVEEKYLEAWKSAKPEHKALYDYYQGIFERRESLRIWEEVLVPEGMPDKLFRSRISLKRRLLRVAGYAAIGVPVLFIVGWLLWQKVGNRTIPLVQVVEQQDIAPGKQKAQLKLENGEVISLSDSSMAIHSRTDIQVENGGVLQYASNIERKQEKAVYHTLVVDRGAEFQLVLPDGTKVWLNSDSELKYPNVFNEDTRQVYLKGEGYFEVKHNEQQPFLVMAGECMIKVLGTEFNISSYEDEGEVAATLVRGKVAYTAGRNKGHLSPGQQCVYDKQKGMAEVKEVNVNQYTSWKNGLFLFDHIRMEELAKQIARWYDVEVFFPDNISRMISFTGAMERYKPVSYIINLLNETNTVDCQLRGKILEFRTKIIERDE